MHVFPLPDARWLAAACLLSLAGCAIPPNGDHAGEPEPVDISDDTVRDVDGASLPDMDAIPGSIQVTRDTAFGASGQFTGGALSPDGAWLAVTTQGVAHGAGWLVEAGTDHPYPAAFQYGGTVEPGPWSADSRYATFTQEGPAPSGTLVVVDREATGNTVEANATPVRLPDHADSVPPDTHYQPLAWRDGALLFSVNDTRYRYDPVTSEVTPAEN